MKILSSLEFSFVLLILLSTVPEICESIDSLSPSQLIEDGNSLVSSGGKFELGFFSPDISGRKKYLGIWYNAPSRPIVWVTNRENPVSNSTGSFKISDDGNLVVVDHADHVLWSSNSKNSSSKSIVAKLLDSGNLILKEEGSDDNSEANYLWQSFDHPTDTMLAGMKLGWDFTNGLNRQLTSWKSADDPSQGQFSYSMDTRGFPQLILRDGNTTRYRSTPHFGSILTKPYTAFLPKLVYNSQEAYYSYDLRYEATAVMLVLNSSGTVQRYVWDDQMRVWKVVYDLPTDSCDHYGRCGPNAVCVTSTYLHSCNCLMGYDPKSPQDWNTFNTWYLGGCVRRNPLNCSGREAFQRVRRVKLPDLVDYKMNTSLTLKECEEVCMRNCSCRGYASTSPSGSGRGCVFWFGDLIDMREVNDFGNVDLFIRVMASDLENSTMKKQMVASTVALSFVLVAVISVCMFWKKRKIRGKNDRISAASLFTGLVRLDIQVNEEESFDLPIFDAISISEATNNFSDSNKLGQGGFGPVYKGQFPNGQEIAVKRLSLNSSQGLNEVILIAKLQHRNLVRLLGCCTEGEERMLIYEYMPNKSLDFFIFGSGDTLPWRTRFEIIVGIARGILYLHRDSRLRIIHRDLKVSNVLLDSEMNAKISDFGMAKAFGENLSSAQTDRIVGTYGYMSPEYAIDGLFSVKSDVFSFGVLVLEILSGKRNREFHHSEHNFNLLGHAWKSWKDEKAFQLIDPNMEATLYLPEVMRCIQIALLCVQQHPEGRPTMAYVVSMLDSGSSVLPQPEEPGFYIERSPVKSRVNTNDTDCTINEMTLTLLNGR